VLVHWDASANFSRHNKRGTGFIERIDTGWPLTPRPPRPQWPKLPKKIRDHFDEVSNFVIQSDVFYGGYLDYDKDHFRQLCRDHVDNLSLPRQRITVESRNLSPCSYNPSYTSVTKQNTNSRESLPFCLRSD
jgi:hypothetical protein